LFVWECFICPSFLKDNCDGLTVFSFSTMKISLLAHKVSVEKSVAKIQVVLVKGVPWPLRLMLTWVMLKYHSFKDMHSLTNVLSPCHSWR
jgi:hypothetical protein